MHTTKRVGEWRSPSGRILGWILLLALTAWLATPGSAWAGCEGCPEWRGDHFIVKALETESNSGFVDIEILGRCGGRGRLEYRQDSENVWREAGWSERRSGWRGGVVGIPTTQGSNFEAPRFALCRSEEAVRKLELRLSCGDDQKLKEVELCTPGTCPGSHGTLATVSGGSPQDVLPWSVLFFGRGLYLSDSTSHDVETNFGLGVGRDLGKRLAVQWTAGIGEDKLPVSFGVSEQDQDVWLSDLRLLFRFHQTCQAESYGFLGGSYTHLDEDTPRFAEGWGGVAGLGFKAPLTYRVFAGADIKARYQHEKESKRTHLESTVYIGLRF